MLRVFDTDKALDPDEDLQPLVNRVIADVGSASYPPLIWRIESMHPVELPLVGIGGRTE